MALNVITLPFLSFATIGLFGRFLGQKGSKLFGIINIFITLLISCFLFYQVSFNEKIIKFKIFSALTVKTFDLSWGIYIDTVTSMMLLVILSISLLVHIYSYEYMGEDPHVQRFFAYLSLFTFFMIVLVTGDNYIQMFIGWEGVGLASYLLINFWFTRIQANKAAIKAMFMNRIGDFALVMGMLLIYKYFNSLDYAVVFSLVPLFKDKMIILFDGVSVNLITIISIFLFIGAMGKSAQFGLHTWLPDAMEGPTPVSALIHAATMVTAGVFLLIRSSMLLEYSNTALIFISLIGGVTAFFGATTGLLQNDVKRIIAYSTCSQLGYMIFACGLSNYSVGFFHLINHAFFKALLFLSAGALIHSMSDEQDLRKMGGLRSVLPFTYVMFLIGSLSLMGFPFLTGFYSKDLILEVAYGKFTTVGHITFILGTGAAFFTAFYSIRLIYLSFLTIPNGYKRIYKNIHESNYIMLIPLAILSIPSIFLGYLLKDLVVGLGSDFFKHFIFFHPYNFNMFDAEFLPTGIKLIPIMFSLSAFILAGVVYMYFQHGLFSAKITSMGYNLYVFLNRKWLFDKIYNDFIGQISLYTTYNHFYKVLDKGLLYFIGAEGLSYTLLKVNSFLKSLHKGLLNQYSLYILFNSFLYISFALFIDFTSLIFVVVNLISLVYLTYIVIDKK